jgi:hypothetical protein
VFQLFRSRFKRSPLSRFLSAFFKIQIRYHENAVVYIRAIQGISAALLPKNILFSLLEFAAPQI